MITCHRCSAVFDHKGGQNLRCPECKFWNISGTSEENALVPLPDIEESGEIRIVSGPWDECLGGGLVTTSVTLLGGAEGAGKSTLALQIASAVLSIRPPNTPSDIYSSSLQALYIGTEEGAGQIASRAKRIKLKHRNRIQVLREFGKINPLDRNTETLATYDDCIELIKATDAAITVLDSLPGLVGDDIRAAVDVCRKLKVVAEEKEMPIVVIDHLNKDDDFAGLRTLQYFVDATLTFRVTDEAQDIRTLRTHKTRFGPAFVETDFFMTEEGLTLYRDWKEIKNARVAETIKV